MPEGGQSPPHCISQQAKCKRQGRAAKSSQEGSWRRCSEGRRRERSERWQGGAASAMPTSEPAPPPWHVPLSQSSPCAAVAKWFYTRLMQLGTGGSWQGSSEGAGEDPCSYPEPRKTQNNFTVFVCFRKPHNSPFAPRKHTHKPHSSLE